MFVSPSKGIAKKIDMADFTAFFLLTLHVRYSFLLSRVSEMCLNILSHLYISVCLSFTEDSEARQYSRLHSMQSRKQVGITEKGEK